MKKTVLVIGLGRLGNALCDKIVRLGHSVMAVDKTHSKVAEIADMVGMAVQLDATDEDAFKALRGRGVSFLVRSRWRPTWANWWITPPEEVLGILDLFALWTEKRC